MLKLMHREHVAVIRAKMRIKSLTTGKVARLLHVKKAEVERILGSKYTATADRRRVENVVDRQPDPIRTAVEAFRRVCDEN